MGPWPDKMFLSSIWAFALQLTIGLNIVEMFSLGVKGPNIDKFQIKTNVNFGA